MAYLSVCVLSLRLSNSLHFRRKIMDGSMAKDSMWARMVNLPLNYLASYIFQRKHLLQKG